MTKDKQPSALSQIIAYAGSSKPLLYLGCVLSGINALISLAPLFCVWFVLRDLIKVFPNFEQASDAYIWALLAVVFSIASLLVYFIALLLTHKSAFRIAANIRTKLLEHISQIPLGYFIGHSSGEMRRTIDSSAASTEDLIAHKLPDFVASLISPIVFIVLAFVFNWLLGLLCLIPILVSVAAMWWMMGRKSAQGGEYFMQRYQQALMDMSAGATEYIRGIPVVKMFQQTTYSFKAFYKTVMDYRDMAYQYTEYCKKPQVFQLVAINSAFAVLVPAGIILAQSAENFSIFLIDFLFYVILSAFITTIMTKVMYATETVMIAQDAVNRINGILAAPIIKDVSLRESEVPENYDISISNLSFSYPGSSNQVLNNVSMKIPASSIVALVGESGGGKTTLASLIPRFWDADSGDIKIGGVSVKEIALKDLMGLVAFVFQNDHLLKMSIEDNLRLARPSASREDILAALKAAQCQDIIDKFDGGINTVIGAEGVYLSGGERQRISLARAILKDAPIVLLDEATAFADPENEALIQKAMSKLCAGKTVLMIAHRLSTVVNVDNIYVLDKGKIAESGSHNELLAHDGIYKNMWSEYQKGISWKIESEGSDVA